MRYKINAKKILSVRKKVVSLHRKLNNKTSHIMKTQSQLKDMIRGTVEYQDMTVEDIAAEVCEYFTARYAADKKHGQFKDVLTAALSFLPKSWAKYDIFGIIYNWCEKAVHTDHRGMKSSVGIVETLNWYVIA